MRVDSANSSDTTITLPYTTQECTCNYNMPNFVYEVYSLQLHYCMNMQCTVHIKNVLPLP